jgi:hypothetical protein
MKMLFSSRAVAERADQAADLEHDPEKWKPVFG